MLQRELAACGGLCHLGHSVSQSVSASTARQEDERDVDIAA